MAAPTGESLGRSRSKNKFPALRSHRWEINGNRDDASGSGLGFAIGGTLGGDIRSLESLGLGTPLWIDHDLSLTVRGPWSSLYRGIPLSRYDVTGTEKQSLGRHVAIFRKTPVTELTIVSIPHPAAETMIRRIDAAPSRIDPDKWQVLGRSVWEANGWVDRDTQTGGLINNHR